MRDAFYSSPQLAAAAQSRHHQADHLRRRDPGHARLRQQGRRAARLKLEKLKESLFDADVEISDDMFILKAEDAQKLLEPPRLAESDRSARTRGPKIGEQASFSCSALDQYGQPFAAPAVTWSATGGTVTAEGLFTAGQTGGLYTVRAEAAGHEAHGRGADHDQGRAARRHRHRLAKQMIRWRGTVPPQKWMNFYTKVLTRFASTPA